MLFFICHSVKKNSKEKKNGLFFLNFWFTLASFIEIMTSMQNLVLNPVDESARGPTPFSHWVIPKLLLASAYPGEKNPNSHKLLTQLKTFTPYQDVMLQYAKEENREIEFVSFPIQDQSVHQDNQCVLDFCLELCDRVKRGQVVLVHCWGGHGRTGTIISIMIGILFNLNSKEAIFMNRRLHDQRIRTNGIPSPEAQSQIDQIRIILDEMYLKNNEKIEYETKM
ncbi:unnamed protein product [Rotaria magnacalcarata]